MIEYVIPTNVDDRVLEKMSSVLRAGDLICFPTETNWVAAGDPFQKGAVDKLYKLKSEESTHPFSLFPPSISVATEVAHIPDFSFRLIKRIIPGHYTFIFESTKKISKVLKASKMNKEVGLRFSPSPLVQTLLAHYGECLIATSLDRPMFDFPAETDEIYSYAIEERFGHQLSLIIDPGEISFVGSTTVVSLLDESSPEILREGVGSLSPFMS